MTQNDLKHLRRTDLLEMLLEQCRENEALRSEIQQLREQQSQQDILLDNAGSIAEASLRLNGVFEAAQRACDQYTANIEKLNARQQRICAKMEKDARETCRKMMEETRKECDRMLEEAKKQADACRGAGDTPPELNGSRVVLQSLIAEKDLRNEQES